MKELTRAQYLLTHHHTACQTLARFSGLPLPEIVSGLERSITARTTLADQNYDHFLALQTVARYAGIDFAEVVNRITRQTPPPTEEPEALQRTAA